MFSITTADNTGKSKNFLDAKRMINEAKINDSSNLLFDIKISADEFTELLPFVLELKNLKKIYLDNAVIKVLYSDMFGGLKNLEELRFETSGLQQVSGNAFRGLDQLAKVTLSGGHFDVLHPNMFKGLKNLEKLTLIADDVQRTSEFEYPLSELASLKELSLSGGHFNVLHPDMFRGLKNLEKLEIKNTSLSRIPADVFKNLPSLKSITFYNNQALTVIEPNAFNNLPSLQELNLSGNAVTTIVPNVLNNLPNLRSVNLSNNAITTIELNAFNNLSSLQELNLSGNAVTTIVPNALNNLPNLTYLSLSGNALTIIPENIFNNIQDAQINLNSNPLTEETMVMISTIYGARIEFDMRTRNINSGYENILKLLNAKQIDATLESPDKLQDYLNKVNSIVKASPQLKEYLNMIYHSGYWKSDSYRNEVVIPTLHHIFKNIIEEEIDINLAKQDITEEKITGSTEQGIISSLGNCATPVLDHLIQTYFGMKSENGETPNLPLLRRIAIGRLAEKIPNIPIIEKIETVNALVNAACLEDSENYTSNRYPIENKKNCSPSISNYANFGFILTQKVPLETVQKFLSSICQTNPDGTLVTKNIKNGQLNQIAEFSYILDDEKTRGICERFAQENGINIGDKSRPVVEKMIDEIYNSAIYKKLASEHYEDPFFVAISDRNELAIRISKHLKSHDGNDSEKRDSFVNQIKSEINNCYFNIFNPQTNANNNQQLRQRRHSDSFIDQQAQRRQLTRSESLKRI